MASHRSTLIAVARIAIPVAIIAYLLWRIEPAQWQQLRDQPKQYGWLVAALLVAIGAMAVSFARWCLLVRCQGIELTMLEAFRLGSICFLLSFVSVGSVGGDLFKAIFLARRRPGRKVAAVASVVVDRACGLYALVLIVCTGLLLADSSATLGLAQIKVVSIALLVIGTAVLLVLVLGGKSVDQWISRWEHRGMFGRLLSHIGPPLRMFHTHPVGLAVAIMMSLIVQGSFVLAVYFIAIGLYPSCPSLVEHAVIVPVGMLASALPLTPAGIGVFEVAIESLYRLVPATPTAASGTLVALVYEMVKLVMAVLATLFYWTANDEVRASLAITEDQGQGG